MTSGAAKDLWWINFLVERASSSHATESEVRARSMEDQTPTTQSPVKLRRLESSRIGADSIFSEGQA